MLKVWRMAIAVCRSSAQELPMLTVAEIGFEQPVTIGPDDDLDTALERLLASDSTELYVTDEDGRLLGILPDFELLKARLTGSWAGMTAGQLSSLRVVCFAPETEYPVVLKAFREGLHSRAAIVQNGCLVGQITRTSILRWLTAMAVEPATPVASPKFLQTTGSGRVRCDLAK
jgi:CBS domain-containing protein